MNLTPHDIKLLANHLSDYVETLKDASEFGGFDRADLERSAANLTEAVQLRDRFLSYWSETVGIGGNAKTPAKTADQVWADRATEITV